MKKCVTIKELAELANVSVATVSVALNNKPGVSEEKKNEILELARRFNYFANTSARSLKTNRSYCIGLIATDIENPFFATVVSEFNQYAEKLGYSIILSISQDNIHREAEQVKTLIGKGIDGLIIIPAAEKNGDISHLEMLKEMKIPFIYCTAYHNNFLHNCVMAELRSGEYQLIRYLLKQGCRRIILLTADRELILSKMRIEGYRQAYEEYNLQYEEEWIVETAPRWQNGYDFAKKCTIYRPDAVVTINDFLAMGLLRGFYELGIRVPEDISVAGYDDSITCKLLTTPLTTVRQPVKEICCRTLDMLIDEIEGKDMGEDDKIITLEPILKVRDTTI